MAAALRAWSFAGNGQASTTSSLSIPVNGSAVAGDVAMMSVAASGGSLTTPAGWTLIDVETSVSGLSTWLLAKQLVAGDPGSSVTLAFFAAVRAEATMLVASGVTISYTYNYRAETTVTGVPRLPSLDNVPAGAFVAGFLNRRYAGSPAPTLGAAAGFTTGTQSATNYSFSSNLTSLATYLVASSSGTYGGSSGSSSPSSTGVDYLISFAPSTPPGPVSISGTTAAAGAAVSDPGNPVIGLSVMGATATALAATAVGGDAVTLLPSSHSTLWPPDPYRAVIRAGGFNLTYSMDAWRGGVQVLGAIGLGPIGGQIVDTTKSGVRRTLTCSLPPTPGLYDLLAPTGTSLTVTGHVEYLNKQVQDIPMGVFDIDEDALEEGGGPLSITAPDKWGRVQRTKFVQPYASTPGITVVQQITLLLQGALPVGETVLVTTSSTATVGALVWDADRAQAIIDLATAAGLWVYFDRSGTATIADIPVSSPSSDWLIDASPTGVLLSLSRQQSRTDTCNVVVVESSASSGAVAFPTQTVWDNDPSSPTYAGPDPINHPELAGPFGISTYHYSTPLPLDAGGAYATGLSILASKAGLASQVSLANAHNPAIDAFQSIDVLGPTPGVARGLERHVVDSVTHQLDVKQAQHIDGRSTRTVAYT